MHVCHQRCVRDSGGINSRIASLAIRLTVTLGAAPGAAKAYFHNPWVGEDLHLSTVLPTDLQEKV